MFVLVDAAYVVTLCEAEDLKGFKLVAHHPASALPQVIAALEGVAARTDAEHCWIKEDWLRRHEAVAGDAAWQQSFDGVVAYASKKGWVDGASKSIRAHIEWAEDNKT